MKIWPSINFISPKNRRNIADYFMSKKEGVIAGAADNDPAGIITYLQVGATTGFALLWLLVIATPMLIVVEQMSAKIGTVLKKGLARVLADYYGIKIAAAVVILVALANTFAIGANISGMADVIAVMFDMEENYSAFVLLVGLLITLFLLRGKYASISRYLFLLTPIFLVYVVTAFLVKPDWAGVGLGLVGAQMKFDLSYWALAVGALGTTIAPYMMFWETTEEVESRKGISDLKEGNSGIQLGMIYSNVIALFMIILSATVLYGHDGTIESVRQASEVLQPLVGNAAFGLFSIGILGAGFVAVPVLVATTAYMVADVFGWKAGLDREQYQAPSFYFIILLAILVGMLVTISGINPIQAMVWSQVLAGCVSPFLVIGLLAVANNKKLMGVHTNSKKANFVGIVTVILMLVAVVLFFVDLIK